MKDLSQYLDSSGQATLARPRRIIFIWLVALIGLPLLYLFSRQVLASDTYIYRYFLALYLIDSLLLFLIIRASIKYAAIILAFLICFQFILASYYGLVHFSAGI